MKALLNNKFSYVALAIILFAIALFIDNQLAEPDFSSLASEFQTILHKKEKKSDAILNEIEKKIESTSYKDLLSEKNDYFSGLYDEKGFIILIYENDTLQLWSDNAVPAEHALSNAGLEDNFVRLRNGWFEVIKRKSLPKGRIFSSFRQAGKSQKLKNGSKTIIGLLLIKNEFPHQNQYLVNDFQSGFKGINLLSGCKIIKEELVDSRSESEPADLAATGTYQIKSFNGNYLCSLKFDDHQSSKSLSGADLLVLLLYVLSFIFLIICIKAGCLGLIKNISVYGASFLFIFTILALRYLTILNKFPQAFYELPFFSPNYYATSFLFPSLGDFFVNSIIIFYLSYFIYKQTTTGFKTLLGFSTTLGLLTIFGLSLLVNSLFGGLIINSNISFNVNNLFELNFNSLTGFVATGLLMFSFFFIADKIVTAIISLNQTAKQLLTGFVISAGIFISICYLTNMFNPVLICWAFTVVIIIGFVKKKSKQDYAFSHIVLLVVVFSLVSAHILSKYNNIKEMAHRKLLAERLVVEQDPVAEFQFQDIEKKIQNDSIFRHYLTGLPDTKESIIKHITERYLSGFWEKYDAQITICKPLDSLLIQPGNTVMECRSFLEGIITEQGEPTITSNFYFLNNNNGRISYLAKFLFPFPHDSLGEVDLFIELDSKFIPQEIGYPELLLNEEISRNIKSEIKNYSYAKYQNRQLINKSGEFPFSITNNSFGNIASDFSFTNLGGFNHLICKIDKNNSIVLSKKNETFLDSIIRFSYLFAFFCLFVLVFTLIRQSPKNFKELHLDFRKRIELSMIFILFVSLLPIGFGTKYYIETQYYTRNNENIKEKIHSVLIEIEHKLAGEEELTDNLKDFMSYILTKFSYVFFTDINLYDLRGNLLASSRPEIFQEGLIGKKINVDAFYQLAIKGKTEFVHNENIGKLNFLSAYVPFRNENNKLLAYLNLPYFAKQSKLKKEISTFLVALINIYVLLFILAIIAALFLSNRITQPLRLIQDKLGKVKLGKTNEPIEWKSKDEIGSLVSEYNRMIIELEKSAELLAKSERESAWREMAKQVAHEIKNPLTPMKLSVQHLEKAWNDKAPDWGEKLKKFTQILIQQIDSLSSIASGFSDFAMMPKAKREVIDFSQVITDSMDLFKDAEGVELNFISNLSLQGDGINKNGTNCPVFADKEQLSQVLNNLIKNAIQAISEANLPEGKAEQGEIGIELSADENNYTVKVTDNGIGISEEQKDKIFTPSFTTKTGGMGLGLAIVKNIIENSGGRVWFESEEGTGSSFYISLPKYLE
ncbi:MAG: HAMP domain-containing sensor histidine kinase [Bacteroidota bacterium]